MMNQTLKLAILGATGSVGKILVQKALDAGHEVTAIARNPESIPPHPRLTTVKADVMRPEGLIAHLKGQDAVLSAFGPRPNSEPEEQRAFAESLSSAMKVAGVRRVVIVSVAFLFNNSIAGVLGRLFFPQVVKGARQAEKVWTASGLDWTILRPPQFTDQPSKPVRVRIGGLPTFGFKITREDVAALVLAEANRIDHFHQVVGIAN